MFPFGVNPDPDTATSPPAAREVAPKDNCGDTVFPLPDDELLLELVLPDDVMLVELVFLVIK